MDVFTKIWLLIAMLMVVFVVLNYFHRVFVDYGLNHGKYNKITDTFILGFIVYTCLYSIGGAIYYFVLFIMNLFTGG